MTRRTIRVVSVAAAGLVLVCLAPAAVSAQTAEARYTAAKERDDKVRELLEKTPASAPTAERTRVITEARATIAAYEALVRAYWRSGYADNALFNAGSLAEALLAQYGLSTDRDAALRYYEWLRKEYPTAPLVRKVLPNIARLEQMAEANAPIAPPLGEDSGPSQPRAADDGPVKLTGIERSTLPDGVRVTITLEHEVPFHQELIEGPLRLFFDLEGVEAPADLVNAVLRYPSDVVRQIRVGRHPDAIRVVLDFEEVGRHSVYMLYNPFRIVVDAESVAAAHDPEPAPATAAASPASTRAVQSDAVPAVTDSAPVAAGPASVEPSAPAKATVARADAAEARDAGKAGAVPSAPSSTTAPAALATPVAPAPPEAASGNRAGGFSIARQLGLGVSRVVIDPGHGGHDPGAQAKGLNEADLTLDIALRLEKLLEKEEGLEVVLTRRKDVYVPLEERTAIANREGADLFLSIHANTSRNTSARGVETYFLSFAGSPDAEAVAARENSAHAGEMHKLPDIIKAIALNNKLDESRDLAGMVQESLIARLRRSTKSLPNRGVKKAPFVVLIGAQMPSVLAEVSFMSNRQELQLLKSATYKQRIAEALHAAVMRYRRSLKGASAIAMQ